MEKITPIPVTAVFDIGKTNKKFLLFDENFEIAYQQYTTLEQAIDQDDDGYPCENLEYLVHWITDQLKTAIQNKNFKIKALNFSTYGASLVQLDGEGKVATPFYDYLKPYPKKLLHQFYETYGGKEHFVVETASPPMGMLNSGLQLYWLKHAKPSLYKNIHHTLHFPQYLSSIFTGNYTSEFTSIGCHTALWNYRENHYHQWLEKEEMLHLFPEIQSVRESRQVQFNGVSFKAGPGIHDSSAALTPYLLAMDEPFMLLSTGTWSAALNPFTSDPLNFDELKRDCLCFMNVYGEHVKAARVFIGNEYEHQKKKLCSYFGRDANEEELMPDISLLRDIIKRDIFDRKLQLETAHTSGPFPSKKPGKWEISQFSSYKDAYHQLMLDLVAIQAESIKLAEGLNPMKKIIITGGFSRNAFFVKLLASRFPEKKIYTASLSHASALGAAMVLNDEHAKKELEDLLKLKRHSALPDVDIEQYRWKRSLAKNGNTVNI